MAKVTFLRDWTGTDGATRRQGEKDELDDATARELQEQGVVSPQGSDWNGEKG